MASTSSVPSQTPTRSSWVAKLIGWVSKKLSFVSRPSLPNTDVTPSNLRSGPRRSTVASAPPPTSQSHPQTEVAIATSEGLKAYIHDPQDHVSSAYRKEPIAVQVDTINSPDSDRGPTSTNQATSRYKNIEQDFSMVVDHLHDRQFWEMRPVNTSPGQSSLKEQITTYLKRPPNSHEAGQVRILILSGHNTSESTELIINPSTRYPWRSLRKSLLGVPPQVTVVVLLACCHAESVLEDVIQDDTISEIVVMAACSRSEEAIADPIKGDYFLDALFGALQSQGHHGNPESWKHFLTTVIKELRESTQEQNPVVYMNTTRTPSDIFHALKKGPMPTPGRTAIQYIRMGRGAAPIQAPPSQLPAEAQWIHTSDLHDQDPPIPGSYRVDSERAPISPPRQPAETGTRRSTIGKVLGWFSRKFSLVSRSSSSNSDTVPKPKLRRGGPRSTVAAAPPLVPHSNPQTEVAIVGSEGLKTYVYDPQGRLHPAYRKDPIPVQTDSADYSDLNLGSTAGANQASGHYQNIEHDVSMVENHLRDMQFSQMRPADESIGRSSLKEQVATYLERPSDHYEASQVRILIFSGHNTPESTEFAINPEVRYPWRGLRKSLMGISPRITVVVILACCHAKAVLEDVMNESIPDVVGMAACDRFEKASANSWKGDYFLDALFEVLQTPGQQGGSEQWEDFLQPVVKELRTNTKDQNPVVYVNTTRTPSDIFRALKKPPVPTSRRGRTSPVVQPS
ncbi:hypothetical protein FRC12_017458 [Ceratobasidium sp. 428]|nr:hypothetical protein FRC12_017458 [Ceratobasidium sp. 428]